MIASDLQRSEIVGLVAGFGTTFAALPDLVRMLRHRSIRGVSPIMATILAVFQVVWIYYGFLIDSRPLVLWNMVAIVINSTTVGVYLRFARLEKAGSEAVAVEQKAGHRTR
ncbi:MAG TPA: SemiSWEET family transporter [Gemmatimonadaceae bacterium]